MKKRLNVFTLILLFGGLVAQGQDAAENIVFHFDFKDAKGKNEIKDTTGKHKCVSKDHGFEIQDGALRIAPDDAKIFILPYKMPPCVNELTIRVWIARKGDNDCDPVLFKGIHQDPIQFLLTFTCQYPEFCYKNQPAQGFWKGIYTIGSSYGNTIRYNTPEWVIKDAKYAVKANRWTNLAVTFSKGNINIYVNGILTLQHKSEGEILKLNDFPIYIGSERIAGSEEENYRTADMLLNDLWMYKTALSAEEIRNAYASEKERYPDKYIMPAPTTAYMSAASLDMKAFDPQFKNKLKITQQYEKNIIKTPFNEKLFSMVKLQDRMMELFINQKETYPMQLIPRIYLPSDECINLSYNLVRDFAAADVNMVAPCFDLSFWTGEDQYDWEKLDSGISKMLEANPNAQMMIYMYLKPPSWFIKKYPGELEKYCHSTESNELKTWAESAPLASSIWRKMSLNFLRATITHIEKSPYANHIYGYLIAGGDAGEWFWAASFVNGGMTGYSARTNASFREWLRTKYNNSAEALQKAWQNNSVSFETAQTPSPKSRESTEFFNFRIKEKAQDVFDFREFMNDITLANMVESFKAVKESSDFKKIVCTYYGYVALFAGGKGGTLYRGGLQNLSKLFECPYIDFIASPLDYINRRGGETGLNINPFYASALLHNKMIWNENDLRTHFHTQKEFGRTSNLQETLTVIKRGFGYSLTQNCGFWYMPFIHAWFHQEDIMQTIADIKKLADKTLKEDRSSISQVAFIMDEKSPDFTALIENNNFMDGLCWDTYQEAAKMGAPFDMYLLPDIKNSAMPDYKLYIFMNSFYIDKATRDAIAVKIRKNNAVAIWCYAPGYITENGFSVEAMKELTGIDLSEIKEQKTLILNITDKTNPIAKYVKQLKPYTFGPVFNVTDKNVKVIGTADNKPALVIKEFSNWKSVYSLLPLNKELLTGLCEFAGVHIYSKSYDMLTANKSFIMLHALSGGEKTIILQENYNVKEILTGKEIGKSLNKFTEKLPVQATRIYQVTK
jgi:hypothetical protein